MTRTNTFKIIKDDLQQTIKKGLELGIISNPRTPAKMFVEQSKITSYYSYISTQSDYLEKYVEIFDDENYLFTLNDGSMLQVNYEFKNSKKDSKISKMNLAYLPPVIDNCLSNDYLRIDYSDSDNSFHHSPMHLHVGFCGLVRLPLNSLSTVSDFLLIVLYMYYKKEFMIWKESLNIITSHTEEMSNEHLVSSPVSKEIRDFLCLNYRQKNEQR